MGHCAAEAYEVDGKIKISAILVVILDVIENSV